MDGEYGWKPLDREPFVGLLRDFATFLTGPIFNRDVLRLRKPVHVPLSPLVYHGDGSKEANAPFKISSQRALSGTETETEGDIETWVDGLT